MSLYAESQKGASRAVEKDGRWLICESAIVADTNDPDKQHRIKVVIPAIDPDLIYDDWVRCASGVCLGDGLGSVFIPEKGQEVLISGVLGQKFNLVYHAPLYHEENHTPGELDKDTPGIKVPKNLSFIAGLLLKLLGQNILAEAEQLATFKGNNADVIATATARVNGADVQVTASNQLSINGATVTINSNGSVTIHGGGNVAVSASGTLTLEGRTVNKSGPSI